MNDINNINNNQNPDRPRFKKVKRAVRREDPMVNFNDPVYNIEDMENADLSSLDLDGYLDEDLDTSSSSEPQYSAHVPALATPQQQISTTQEDEMPRFLEEGDITYTQETVPHWLSVKTFISGLCGALVIGILIAKLFLTPSQVVRNGLQGLVPNPEIPKGRARCGLTDKTQGCVLYIMNPQRQELNGRDFYDLAAQLTGRQRFVIETGNMRYSNIKVRPGEIAQLNIPPL